MADELDAEVEQEVTEECSRYGKVERVVIYQEKQSDAPDAESVVKIFVEFAEPEGNMFNSSPRRRLGHWSENSFDRFNFGRNFV